MNLLALDLSTKTIGYSIFSLDSNELLKMDYYSYTSDDLVDKGFEVQNLLLGIDEEYKVNTVVIEERLKKFSPGRTNADAMFKTAQINYISQFICKSMGKEIIEINVMNARGRCFPGFHKLARVSTEKHKDIAFEMTRKILGDDKFPKKVLSSGPRKGLEIFLDEAQDMADSWVIGMAYFDMQVNPAVEKKEKPKKKKANGK